MMTLPEFKAWVDGLHSAAPAMSPQLFNQRVQEKLRDECSRPAPPYAQQNLTKGWVNPADRDHGAYIMGPFGPEQPL